MHRILMAVLVGASLSGAAYAATPASEAPAENAVQSADAKIEKCLTDSRAAHPDTTDHGKRIIAATQCICTQAAEVCNHSQMIQDYRLRQRVLDDK